MTYLRNLRYITIPDTYKKLSVLPGLALTLAEVKAYLIIPVTDTSRDAWLTMLIKTSMHEFEEYARRVLIKATFITYRNNFPFTNFFELRKSPLVSVESVEYLDVDKVWQTMDSTEWMVTNENYFSKIVWNDAFKFPSLYEQPQPIRINFTAGMATDDTDTDIHLKEGLLAYIAFMFENKGDCLTTKMDNAFSLPPTTIRVFDGYKIFMI